MSAADLLRDVVRTLDAAGIPYMLVGSFASAAVLAVGADALDHDYLDHWAAELGITELLARARRG